MDTTKYTFITTADIESIAKTRNIIFIFLYFPIYGKFLCNLNMTGKIIVRPYTYSTFTDMNFISEFIKKYYCPKHNPIIITDNSNPGPHSDDTIYFKLLYPFLHVFDIYYITLIHQGNLDTNGFQGKLLSPQEIMNSRVTDLRIKYYIHDVFKIPCFRYPKEYRNVDTPNAPEPIPTLRSVLNYKTDSDSETDYDADSDADSDSDFDGPSSPENDNYIIKDLNTWRKNIDLAYNTGQKLPKHDNTILIKNLKLWYKGIDFWVEALTQPNHKFNYINKTLNNIAKLTKLSILLEIKYLSGKVNSEAEYKDYALKKLKEFKTKLLPWDEKIQNVINKLDGNQKKLCKFAYVVYKTITSDQFYRFTSLVALVNYNILLLFFRVRNQYLQIICDILNEIHKSHVM